MDVSMLDHSGDSRKKKEYGFLIFYILMHYLFYSYNLFHGLQYNHMGPRIHIWSLDDSLKAESGDEK